MKKTKLLATLLIAATMTSCGGNDTSSETETANASVTTISEKTEASTVDTEKNEETVVTTSEEKNVTSEETTVTTAETTYFVPANAMKLNVDNLLLTIEGWVYNNGIRDESACYFFCILDDGTVYTMKYKTSESDTAYENAFTKKLYSCDNSVWDLAENIKAVGNIFSQMNYEMLMENFTSINWDSDYYERPYDEAVPAVDPVYAFITYLYPLKDGKKTAVLRKRTADIYLTTMRRNFCGWYTTAMFTKIGHGSFGIFPRATTAQSLKSIPTSRSFTKRVQKKFTIQRTIPIL